MGGVYYNENDPKAAAVLRVLMERGEIPHGFVDERDIRDVRPADLAGYRQCHFFAGIGGWPLVLRNLGIGPDEPIWTGSCPCFAEGHLVVTRRGLVPVEDVRVGDEVWTHRLRWRRVVRTGSDFKPTGTLVGQGHFGLEVTADHPFLSRSSVSRSTRRLGRPVRVREVSEPCWTSAEDMPGRMWAQPARFPDMPVPEQPFPLEDFAFLAGIYVGDGWIGTGSRFGQIVLGLNEEKAARIEERLPEIPFSRSEERTGPRLHYENAVVAKLLEQEFGKGASNKRLPLWLLGASEKVRAAFLEGWHLTDGTRKPVTGCLRLTTTSRGLAVTGRMLAVSLGYSCSMRYVRTSRTTVIENRRVRQRDYYTLSRSRNGRYKIADDDLVWFRAKTFHRGSLLRRVYNIEVEGDHSYVVDGIVVHNCQPFSTAGRRKGASDERHLWPHWYHLVRQCQPPVVLGEQVASKDGLGWLDLVSADLEAAGYAFGASDLCAAGVGAPHIRQRLYFGAYHSGSSGTRGVVDRLCAGLEGHAGHGDRGDEPGWLAEIEDGPASEAGASGRLADAEHPERRAFHLDREDGRDGPNRGRQEAHGLIGPRSEVFGLADATGARHHGPERGSEGEARDDARLLLSGAECASGRLADALLAGRPEWGTVAGDRQAPGSGAASGESHDRPRPIDGFWRSADWIFCRDGKWRPVEPASFPLADGVPARMVRLRGYGNAIVPPLAQVFLTAFLEAAAEACSGRLDRPVSRDGGLTDIDTFLGI